MENCSKEFNMFFSDMTWSDGGNDNSKDKEVCPIMSELSHHPTMLGGETLRGG